MGTLGTMGTLDAARLPDVSGMPNASFEGFQASWMTGVRTLQLADKRDPNSSGLVLDEGLRLKQGTTVRIKVKNPLSASGRRISIIFQHGNHRIAYPLGLLTGLPHFEHLQTMLNATARVEVRLVKKDSEKDGMAPLFITICLVLCVSYDHGSQVVHWGVVNTFNPLPLEALAEALEEARVRVELTIPRRQAARVFQQLRLPPQSRVEMYALS